MIDWTKHKFAALEARPDADGNVVLHGHDSPDCALIEGKVAANTSLIGYLTARNRIADLDRFPEPTACTCVDVIEAQLALLDEVAAPTPVEIPFDVPSEPMTVPTPVINMDLIRDALAFLNVVDAQLLAKAEFLQAMKQKQAENSGWLPSQKQAEAILKFNRPKAPAGPQVDLRPLAAGKYAVGTALFRIDKPSQGKWAGWIFAKMMVPTADGGQEWDRIATQNPTEDACKTKKGDFLTKIVADPVSTAAAAVTLESLMNGATA